MREIILHLRSVRLISMRSGFSVQTPSGTPTIMAEDIGGFYQNV
jgi:hypothetical protein